MVCDVWWMMLKNEAKQKSKDKRIRARINGKQTGENIKKIFNHISKYSAKKV